MPRKWRPTRTLRGRAVHSSYDLPHRVHVVKAYPLIEPLGATPVVYGHETGITVVWRGGQSMATRNEAEEAAGGEASGGPVKPDSKHNEFGTDDAVTHHLDIQLMTPVLDIAFPDIPPPISLPTAEPLPRILSQSIIIVAACANNKVFMIRCPLRPERTIAPRDEYDAVRMAHIELTGKPYNVAATWTAAEDYEPGYEFMKPAEFAPRDPPNEYDLLVALATREAFGRILLVRLPLVFPQSSCFPSDEQYLQYPVVNIAFSPASYPSEQHSRLLIAHSNGYVSVYDPLLPQRRWLSTFSTAFEAKAVDENAPALLDRKRLLSAQWVANGQGIIALLEHGEWGVWDYPQTPSKSSSPAGFVLHNYVNHHTATLSSGPLPNARKTSRGSRNSLAPMTPKTRLEKEENLFVGSGELDVAASTCGGISVFTTASASGSSIEDCITLWFNNKIYNISSVQRLRSRATKASQGTGSAQAVGGSLYGPGLTHIADVDLKNEMVTSVARLHNQKYVIAGEKRLLFLSPSTTAGVVASPPQCAFSFAMPVRNKQPPPAKRVGFAT